MDGPTRRPFRLILAAAVCVAISAAAPLPAAAQGLTLGCLLNDPASFDGYTLFAPMPSTTTYLIDNGGFLVHEWASSTRPALSAYLLESGNLVRTGKVWNPNFEGGGTGGRVQEFSWNGDLLWEYVYSSAEHHQHHDVEPLPSGNVLMVAWELKSAAEAISQGRNPALLTEGKLWPDHIVEIEPDGASGGTIVWEWHVYGVVADHPELVDLNYVGGVANADWNHVNSVDYHEAFDQIILSVHGFGEVWVVDHSTTTQEAAGHTGGASGRGGDLLYRWGNPQTYDAADPDAQQLFRQHDARWIPEGLPGEGNILVFNNGSARPGPDYSEVDEIVPPVDTLGNYTYVPGMPFEPDEPSWIYTAGNPIDFFAQNISGAERLPNSNTLICHGSLGTFFEVTAELDTVWIYVSPVTMFGPLVQGDPAPPDGRNVFRATRYAPDYAGFEGHELTPGDPIELYPSAVEATDPVAPALRLHPNRPNPFNPRTAIAFDLPQAGEVRLTVLNVRGQKVATLVDGTRAAGTHTIAWDGRNERGGAVSSGVYFVRVEACGEAVTRAVTLLR